MKKPEVLAPAGDMDRLRAALRFGADAVYLAGSEFSAVAHGLPVFPDTDSLLEFLKAEPLSGYHILIKGSNSMHMERCIDLL